MFFIFFVSSSFCIRDPFNIIKLNSKTDPYKKSRVIKLIGIVNLDNSFAAILKRGLDHKIVNLNGYAWGYKINKITLNEVVLNKNTERLRLFLT